MKEFYRHIIVVLASIFVSSLTVSAQSSQRSIKHLPEIVTYKLTPLIRLSLPNLTYLFNASTDQFDKMASDYGYRRMPGPSDGWEKRIQDKYYVIVKEHSKWLSFYVDPSSSMVDELKAKLRPFAQGVQAGSNAALYLYKADGKSYQIELHTENPNYIMVAINSITEEFHADELIERN